MVGDCAGRALQSAAGTHGLTEDDSVDDGSVHRSAGSAPHSVTGAGGCADGQYSCEADDVVNVSGVAYGKHSSDKGEDEARAKDVRNVQNIVTGSPSLIGPQSLTTMSPISCPWSFVQGRELCTSASSCLKDRQDQAIVEFKSHGSIVFGNRSLSRL